MSQNGSSPLYSAGLSPDVCSYLILLLPFHHYLSVNICTFRVENRFSRCYPLSTHNLCNLHSLCSPCNLCSPYNLCSPCNLCNLCSPCSPCSPCNPCNPCHINLPRRSQVRERSSSSSNSQNIKTRRKLALQRGFWGIRLPGGLSDQRSRRLLALGSYPSLCPHGVTIIGLFAMLPSGG